MANGPKENDRFTCYFTLWAEKETKGTFRYQQTDKAGKPYPVENGAEFGSLYIRKSAFGGNAPQKITVVVSKEK
jgi:hypothetical protein